MVTFSKNTLTVNITLPTSWQELNQKQMRLLFALLAEGYTETEVKTFFLFRWSGIKILYKYNNGYYCKLGKQEFVLEAELVASAINTLNWINKPSVVPVRLEKIGRHSAIEADFQGVPFEVFIICDNLYQGYLNKQDDELLNEMATHLYLINKPKLSKAERIGIFYWFTSLKSLLAHNFHHFFQPTGAASCNLLGCNSSLYQLMQDSINAQIRALTKGDVTKEKEVLLLDTWRALTELDAQAREYEELNSKYPSK